MNYIMNIILDTNFLIDCARFKINCSDAVDDVEGLYGKTYFIILDCCYDELQRISRTRTASGKHARIEVELTKSPNFRIVKANKMWSCVDSSLIDYAKKHKDVVATNDRKLIEKLKIEGIRVLRIRQRKRLVLE